jgi:zinc protease
MKPGPKIALACGATLVLGFGLSACGRSSVPEPGEIPRLEFEKYSLANGLEVILSEDHRLPLVAVDVWYHVGPANEAAGRTGFAHLFEHMMFQGSKHVPGDGHFRLLEAAGGSNLNGTTNFDRTNYFETLPANELELGLWLESDRLGYLLDTVDELKLANQQDVVRNERRQSVENAPYGLVQEALFHQLFPPGHPYYASVIGSHADIQAARLDDVKTFFRQYYAPNNASLAVVGDIDKARTKQLIEKYFGTLKRGPDVPKVAVQTPPITAERRAVVKDNVQLPRVYMAWITPPFFKPGDSEADIAATILGGGKSSRLYKKLVYEKQIAQDVNTFQYSLALGSTFQIVATARPGRTAEELEAAINQELEAFRQTGPEAREVERARNTFETQLLHGLEVLGGFGGVADTLNMFNHYLGDPGYLPKYLEDHRRVTPAEVRTFAQSYLSTASRVVVYGVAGEPDLGPVVPTPSAPPRAPGAGAEAVNADEPWRKDQPRPAAARPVQLPTPSTFTLANGLTVLFHERPGMPVVTAQLVTRSGSDANPVDKPGLANFVAAMLDQGTASRNALQIADDVAQIGATLTASSSKDSVGVSVQALVRNFPAALELLADVSLRANFPESEMDRQRQSRLGSLVAMRQNPANVASAVAVSALYGPRHVYGYIELGTEAAVKTTQRDHLVGYWKKNFVPANAALVVAGPVPQADLRKMVEQAFGSWSGAAPPPVSLGAPGPTGARIAIVDRPKAQQTELLVAAIGAERSTPDFAAVNVMNALLGGLFSSRINLNLREKHGYTYGAYSQFLFRKTPGPFWIGSAVRTEVTAAAVTEILREVEKMTGTVVTAAELTMAKDSITRALPSEWETTSSTAGTLSSLFVYALGLDYFTKYPTAVAAVTPEAVQAAARKYLVPDRMIVIAVGDRATVEPALGALKLGAVELRNADGTPAVGR